MQREDTCRFGCSLSGLSGSVSTAVVGSTRTVLTSSPKVDSLTTESCDKRSRRCSRSGDPAYTYGAQLTSTGRSESGDGVAVELR